MKHKTIKELLPLYIDKGLNQEEKILIKTHLETCQECQNLLEEYRHNYNLLSSMDEVEIPDNFLPTLMKKIRRENSKMDKKTTLDIPLLERIKKLFRTPVKLPVGLIGLSVLLVIILFTGLPGNLGRNDNFSGLDNPDQLNYQLEDTRELQQKIIESGPRLTQEAPLADQDLEIPEDQRKIIQRAYLSIEVKQLENINDLVLKIIERNNGYIASSRDWITEDSKYSWYRLRIPADNFNSVITELTAKNIGRVVSRSITGEDVTEEFIDLEARLTNLTRQEERYRQLLDKAESVEDILKVENELTRIRSNIESLESRLKYLNNQVSMSTIEVEFREIQSVGITNWGIIRALQQAVQKMSNSIYRIITGLGSLLPYLIILLIGYYIYKFKKRTGK